jgi:hypothetical protein
VAELVELELDVAAYFAGDSATELLRRLHWRD